MPSRRCRYVSRLDQARAGNRSRNADRLYRAGPSHLCILDNMTFFASLLQIEQRCSKPAERHATSATLVSAAPMLLVKSYVWRPTFWTICNLATDSDKPHAAVRTASPGKTHEHRHNAEHTTNDCEPEVPLTNGPPCRGQADENSRKEERLLPPWQLGYVCSHGDRTLLLTTILPQPLGEWNYRRDLLRAHPPPLVEQPEDRAQRIATFSSEVEGEVGAEHRPVGDHRGRRRSGRRSLRHACASRSGRLNTPQTGW